MRRFLLPLAALTAFALPSLHAQPAQKGKAGQPAKPVSFSERLFAPSALASPQLSPSGKLVASLNRTDDTHYALILTDLEAHTQQPLVQSPSLSVIRFWWKNDDLLMILVTENAGARTFRSLDLKTKKVNDLEVIMHNGIQMIDRLPDEPDNVLVGVAPEWADGIVNTTVTAYPLPTSLARVNLRTGRKQTTDDNPDGGGRWLVNHHGDVVGIWGFEKEHWYLSWRTGPKEKWQRITQQSTDSPDWEPLGLAPDQRRFIVKEYKKTRFERICLLDPATGDLEEISGVAGLDYDSVDRWGSHEDLAIVRYQSPKDNLRFLNSEAEETYRWLGTLFPGTQFSCESFSQDDQRIIVRCWSDQNPGVYFLVDRTTKKATPLGLVRAGVNPNQMAPSKFFQFKTSDGLPLTGRINLPANVAKPPLILFTGASLAQAASDDFIPEVQFFVSHGYAVARINHRGTIGFGLDFGQAGDMQVATGMANDLLEGVKWLGDQGWIDAQRVGLFTVDSGALIGLQLAGRKDVFKAVVGFNPTVDLTNWQPQNFLWRANRTDKDLLAVMGGTKGLADYRKVLDPVAAAEKVPIPAHYFFWRSTLTGKLSYEARKFETRLKETGRNYEFITADDRGKWNPDLKGEYPAWKELARHYDEAADFFAKNL
jgi:dipeptidyl aminopeptidase/acylaminoacyl peptidase